ncbi:MAG: glycosyltransferase family 2 protein [Gemmiger sp.]|nr:glycosyltransferase family 2 protein [Gemmiger sp.]
MPVLSACIVSYGNPDEVIAAAKSVLQHTPNPDFTLYLVDNASPDDTAQRLAATDFGDARVQLLCLPENLGFGGGHNAVLPRLKSDIHFILNPDILLETDALNGIANWMIRNQDAVMATPQLYFPDGRVQHLPRRKPTPYTLLARQLATHLPGSVFATANDHYTMQDEDLSQPHEIEFCTGSFAAIRTAIFKRMGGFDNDYFMYVEDADLTQKALEYGKVYLLPQFAAVHAWHREPMRDAGKFAMQLKSMGRFFKKWGIRRGNV